MGTIWSSSVCTSTKSIALSVMSPNFVTSPQMMRSSMPSRSSARNCVGFMTTSLSAV
jgi:hypothetical protein